ncbi:hydantoinase B/oxoprolinase [Oesophagostomum dentatum]|uniref:Hydantoinase B/oxoprolinase n=1 Tax=Oesophagostomum dentatum TaxID=61180 RepID=A0A0B1T0H5_OESDE|nr:hydantoinase B/oxoprolinase [Oesophagostomum dentatum]
MSIAEQMGRVLQRTAISTNIKERLDFSCALFGPDGGLIANAPHIPVHLGGMQYAVRFQIDHLGMDSIHDGDVILSNHPRAGGSHLPDLTVITPGISLVCDLIGEYGLDTVQAYMQHIQSTAEESVRNMLKEVGQRVLERTGSTRLQASDKMDDGTEIRLAITINIEKGEALFDFTGTGIEVFASWNCPRAVTMSAIIYCLRCLVAKDIPLNSGCLTPITISIPDGTLLSPSETAAVVGGNVLTSQRLCDVILGAFEAVAASQGCMNNVTFGDESMGYYDTIAGGAGAGEGFDGRSGVHTHMTNTRITDPEILESRYPVILREFRLRENSGGAGKWRGGDGVVRSLQFRRPLSLSLLTERRVFSPYGLHGGAHGARGVNLLKRKSRIMNLGGKITLPIETGDVLEIQTPGGGGFGTRQSDK